MEKNSGVRSQRKARFGRKENKDRGAKAELNRRGQACEVLTGTGISRRGIGRT